MIRFLILSGYFELMMYLQLTGKLNQFINVHYRYLATISMFVSLFLALVQLYFWMKEEKTASEHEGHHHGLEKRSQRIIAYFLLALPVIVGTFFPTVSLNTTIVEAKGFNFPLSEESVGDPDFDTQYLQPDTSIYFTKAEYDDQMEMALSKYRDLSTIEITDENYLEVMELIYAYPSEFIGKSISYTGFVYQATKDEPQDVFLFRFGIIHCVADSGVFGLRADFPDGFKTQNDQWLQVKGVIQSQYYPPFKRDLPIIHIEKAEEITPPANQYVYRSF